jgi:hypothetical protein
MRRIAIVHAPPARSSRITPSDLPGGKMEDDGREAARVADAGDLGIAQAPGRRVVRGGQALDRRHRLEGNVVVELGLAAARRRSATTTTATAA